MKSKFLLTLSICLFAFQAFANPHVSGDFNPCAGTPNTYSVDNTDLPYCGFQSCTDWLGNVHNSFLRYEWHVTGGTIVGSGSSTSVNVIWNCGTTGNVYCKITCIFYELWEDISNPGISNCVERESTYVISDQKAVHVSCPEGAIMPSSFKKSCCNPAYQGEYDITTALGTELSFDGIETPQILSAQEDLISGQKKFRIKGKVSTGTSMVIVTVTDKCGNVLQYPVPVTYLDYGVSSFQFPSELCGGQTSDICLDLLNSECLTLNWKIEYLDAAGNNVKPTINVSNTNNNLGRFCQPITANPTPGSYNETMKITLTYSSPCDNVMRTQTFTIQTPSGVPPAPVLSLASIPNTICPCKTSVNLSAGSLGAATGSEWEISDGTTTEQSYIPIGINFTTSFCYGWMFGTSNVNGPFRDITIRVRTLNVCGYSSWSSITIPASRFLPSNHPSCQ